MLDKITTNQNPSKILILNSTCGIPFGDAEKQHIERILQQTGGSRTKAFEILQYGSYNTFLKKLREYKLTEKYSTSD
ncbi:MAG: helix-turn-helix domain-containing protein [Bacteroidales bacterium]